MRIDRTGQSSATAGTARRVGSGAGGFSIEDAAGPARSGPVRQAMGVASLQALIEVQLGEESLSKRRRAVRRGHDLLGLLEEVKIGLLSGRLSPAKLERLARVVGEAGEEVDEAPLQAVLAEIELRAQVELAKFGRAA